MPMPFSRLLLQLLHQDPRLPTAERIASLRPDDWHALTDTAIHCRVAFQLNEYLKTDASLRARVPASDLQRLHATVHSTFLWNLKQQAQLRKMLAACAAAEVPLLLLKGLWLTETIYRNLQARSAADIDLLLHPADMPRFTRLAQHMGFQVPPTIADIRDIAVADNEFALTHPTWRVRCDIHWSLTHPIDEAAVDEEPFWRRAETVTLAGMPCRSLCLEDHLLLLCFHAAIHHRFLYVGPRAMADVAGVIAQSPRPIDWHDVLTRAHELDWSRGVWLMLDLVREHLGVAPPAWVLDGLRPLDADAPDIRQAALDAMFLDQHLPQTLGITMMRLMNQRSLRARALLLLKRLVPARRHIAHYFKVPLDHPRLHWLYVKRCGLILRQHAPKLFHLWVDNPQRQAELKRSNTIAHWLQHQEPASPGEAPAPDPENRHSRLRSLWTLRSPPP